jgi:hypothetical protein
MEEAQQMKRERDQTRKREEDQDESTISTDKNRDNVPHQLTSGKKRRLRNLAKCYYDRNKLQEKNEKLQRKLHRYETQVSRLKIKLSNANDKMSAVSTSPNSVLHRDLKGKNVPSGMRRRLLLGEAILHDLKDAWRKMKSRKKKRKFFDCIQFQYVKKYHFMSTAKPFFPVELYPPSPKKKFGAKKKAFESVRKQVHKFFLRDDISSVAPGKKKCVARNKQKKNKSVT